MSFYFLGRHPNRTGQLCICLTPGLWVAGINKGKNFSPVHSLLYFIDCHSSRLHIFLLTPAPLTSRTQKLRIANFGLRIVLSEKREIGNATFRIPHSAFETIRNPKSNDPQSPIGIPHSMKWKILYAQALRVS
jgi:hypothetical protein